MYLALYARKIAAYSADVAAYVLTTQPNVSKFSPAWAELWARLEMWGGRRKRLGEAISRIG